MFELSIALKYLIPKKKHLSVTLIATISLAVISLVVWLLLVFLSVTEGMEKSWLSKLTTLSSPIRITPKEAYFSSYYHQVDQFSNASNFSSKTLSEKLLSRTSDPYNPEEDPELPRWFPKKDLNTEGELVDPVKGLSMALQKMQTKHAGFFFQDYEMSGAMLKVQMLRKGSMHFLTQVSYLSTPPKQTKLLSSLLVSPSKEDINHLFFLAGYQMEGELSDEAPRAVLSTEEFHKEMDQLLSWVKITSVSSSYLPISAIPDGSSLTVWGRGKDWIVAKNNPKPKFYEKATLHKNKGQVFIEYGTKHITLSSDDLLSIDPAILFSAHISKDNLLQATSPANLQVKIEGKVQNTLISAMVPWSSIKIETFSLVDKGGISSPWVHGNSEKETNLPIKQDGIGILLPKGFHDHGVLLGDRGFLSYTSSTTSALQELRTPIFVAGFYDPGIFSVGNKCLLVPSQITKTINSSNASFQFDKIATNGFQVWFDNLSSTSKIQKEIERALEEQGISAYWQVTPFYEYDFAKDLLQQFQSDRYLFSLIGIIILIVACSNIVSFLVLLVNDKKKEIAILQSMGASRASIVTIFGVCGLTVGLIGTCLGIGAGMITLQNIDTLAHLLSALQGHDAFLQSFYGTSLPSTLSLGAVWLIALATPILSLLAAMIPAWKASRLQPSTLLRT